MKLSVLRKNLKYNKDGIVDTYISWLVSNCTDDADLETDFEQEDYQNLISFYKDWFGKDIINDEDKRNAIHNKRNAEHNQESPCRDT